MIVVDGGVIATGLVDDGADGEMVRDRLRGEVLAAPQVIDLEVASVWRRLVMSGELDERRAELALRDLTDLRVDRVDHRPLLQRCWKLRNNLTVYDAAYVAVAELLDCTLLTADSRLANAPGVDCDIELVSSR